MIYENWPRDAPAPEDPGDAQRLRPGPALKAVSPTGVCEKNTPPEKKTLGEISLKNSESGAGEEFLLLLCRGKGRVKGVFLFTDTGRAAAEVYT